VVGQFAQSMDLRSATSNVLLTVVSEEPSGNKDNNKRDVVTYQVDIIGTVQLECETKADNIRNLLEPLSDEYIYLITYDSSQRFYEEDSEVYRIVLTFSCYKNGDGLNSPTGYYEYYALFDWFTGDITLLNQNEANYIPISWDLTPVNNIDYGGTIYTFTATHTLDMDDVEVFFLMPNNQGTPLDIYNYGVNNDTLELSLYWESDVLIETRILIRVRKSASGAFAYDV